MTDRGSCRRITLRSRALTLPKLLLVDDESLIRKVFLRMLRGEGYHVLDASSGVEAIDLFAKHQPIDILLTDLRLTGNMSGGDLAKELLKRQPSLRVVIMSGDLPTDVAGLDAGAYQALQKPFAMDDLKDILKNLTNP